MLMKYLLPKCSSFLCNQGKSFASPWRYTVRRYGPPGSSSSESITEIPEDKWHKEKYSCNPAIDKPHSPFNIITRSAVHRKYHPFSFTSYDKKVKMEMSNNGTHVIIDIPGKELHYSGGGVRDTYTANHIHFHHGRSKIFGSEHFIDSKCYPVEMHIVHNNKNYPNLATAEGKPLGISVLAFMFEKTVASNDVLDPIINALKEIKKPMTTVPIELPSLLSILPPDVANAIYYQYTDMEGVIPHITWTVFKERILMSEDQLAEFHKLQASEVHPLTEEPLRLGDNNRSPRVDQKLIVFTNEADPSEESAEDEEKGKSFRGKLSKAFKGITGKK
ncbi:hypothetical protein BsWGS_07491 [Bradybaena similaris]